MSRSFVWLCPIFFSLLVWVWHSTPQLLLTNIQSPAFSKIKENILLLYMSYVYVTYYPASFLTFIPWRMMLSAWEMKYPTFFSYINFLTICLPIYKSLLNKMHLSSLPCMLWLPPHQKNKCTNGGKKNLQCNLAAVVKGVGAEKKQVGLVYHNHHDHKSTAMLCHPTLKGS